MSKIPNCNFLGCCENAENKSIDSFHEYCSYHLKGGMFGTSGCSPIIHCGDK
jgi:hypothetical protein